MKSVSFMRVNPKSFNFGPISYYLFEKPLIDSVYRDFITDFAK